MTSAGFTLLLWGLYCLFLAISGQDYTTENPVTATYVSPREICSNQNSSDAKHSSCLMVQNWVQKKNAIVAAGLVNNDLPSNSPGNGLQAFGVPTQQEADQQAPLSSQSDMYDCMDLDCYCTKTGGTTNPDGTCTTVKNGESVTYGKSRRKECRMLTDDERNFLWHCIHALKWGTQQSTYNQKVYLHQAAQAPIAHGGPLFPCWHREYIKRYEFDLRNVHPNCQLCYWDSSLDNNLDDARQSCWWTDDFMGEANPNGTIKNGPFKNWTTVEMRPLTRMFPRPDGLIDKNDAKAVAAYDMMSVMAFTSDADDCTTPDEIQAKYYQLEYMHGTPHNFISGEMESTDTAPNDPMFHIHHCFVDYLWETWRVQENKSGNDPTQLYPEKYIVDNHCANLNFSMDQPMQPFNEIINRWCMSANYTNFLYDYEPSPTCNMTNSCGSPFLFCNYEKSSSGQDTSYCVAKIRPGGTCTKFSNPPTSGQTSLSSDDINPCYKSQCMNVGGNWTCVNSTDNNISNLIEIDVNGSNPVIRLDYKMKKGSDPVDTAKPIDPSKETYKGKPGGKKDDKKNDDKKKEKDKQKDDKKKDDKKEKKKKKKVKLPKIKIPPFRVCYDNHECCPQWSLDGYCANHTSFFMNVWCPASCECDGCMLKPMKKDVLCDDKHPSCKKWLNKKQTECTANQHWMAANCAKSCGICDKRESVSASCTGGPMAKGYYVGSFQLQGFLPRHVDEDNDEISDENNNENA